MDHNRDTRVDSDKGTEVIQSRRPTIRDLTRLENDLLDIHSGLPAVQRAARINLLRYLQVAAVKQFEHKYDYLLSEVKEGGDLESLLNIMSKHPPEGQVLQPRLSGSSKEYLEDAASAKRVLDSTLELLAKTPGLCEAITVEVKTLSSVERKAAKFFDGDLRKVTDMARASLICDTPTALADTFQRLTQVNKFYVYVHSSWCVDGRTSLCLDMNL